jgi:hypothetical protein
LLVANLPVFTSIALIRYSTYPQEHDEKIIQAQKIKKDTTNILCYFATFDPFERLEFDDNNRL